jgi:hypothetical protein
VFVITADQVDSRHRTDLAATTVERLGSVLRGRLALPVDRTAGDEIQLLLDSAEAAITAILLLTRDAEWSVGCGIGEVNTPLPANTREATGPAFVAAREAVEAAKKRDTRFALRLEPTTGTTAGDLEAIIDLVLHLRARRSPQGWELYDLMVAGGTQAEAANELKITPQAASKRARAAVIRPELTAIPPLVRLLALADGGPPEKKETR